MSSFSLVALRMFLQEVAAAAPALPFYYYHIPNLTGVHCENATFLYTILIHEHLICAIAKPLSFL